MRRGSLNRILRQEPHFPGETVWDAFIENHAMDIVEEYRLLRACEERGLEWPDYRTLEAIFAETVAKDREAVSDAAV